MRILNIEITLAICAISDLKDRVIDIRVLILSLMIFLLSGEQITFTGSIPGISLIAASIISKERIGSGDAYVIAYIGLISGLWDAITVATGASFLILVASAMHFVIKNMKRFIWKGIRKRKDNFFNQLGAYSLHAAITEGTGKGKDYYFNNIRNWHNISVPMVPYIFLMYNSVILWQIVND